MNPSVARAMMMIGVGLIAAVPGRCLAADTTPPVITHTPVTRAPVGVALKISASIADESGIFGPTLFYRPAGVGQFLTAPMALVGAFFVATIPEAMMHGDVEYFIEAYDEVGNGPGQFASAKAPQRVSVKAGSSPQPTEGDAEVTQSSGGSGLRPLGYALDVVGVALLGGGVVLGVLAKSAHDDAVAINAKRDPTQLAAFNAAKSSVSSRALGADLCYAGAVVAAGLGVYFTFSSPSSDQPSASVSAAPIAGGGAVLLTGGF